MHHSPSFWWTRKIGLTLDSSHIFILHSTQYTLQYTVHSTQYTVYSTLVSMLKLKTFLMEYCTNYMIEQNRTVVGDRVLPVQRGIAVVLSPHFPAEHGVPLLVGEGRVFRPVTGRNYGAGRYVAWRCGGSFPYFHFYPGWCRWSGRVCRPRQSTSSRCLRRWPGSCIRRTSARRTLRWAALCPTEDSRLAIKFSAEIFKKNQKSKTKTKSKIKNKTKTKIKNQKKNL